MLTYRLHVERLAEVVLLPAHQAVSPGMEVASRSETGRVRQPRSAWWSRSWWTFIARIIKLLIQLLIVNYIIINSIINVPAGRRLRKTSQS